MTEPVSAPVPALVRTRGRAGPKDLAAEVEQEAAEEADDDEHEAARQDTAVGRPSSSSSSEAAAAAAKAPVGSPLVRSHVHRCRCCRRHDHLCWMDFPVAVQAAAAAAEGEGGSSPSFCSLEKNEHITCGAVSFCRQHEKCSDDGQGDHGGRCSHRSARVRFPYRPLGGAGW